MTETEKFLRQERRRKILDTGCAWLLVYFGFIVVTLVALFIATRWIL